MPLSYPGCVLGLCSSLRMIQEQMILINIPCTVFAMTFFPWNAFSLTFKGVQTDHLSWSLPHHALLLCLGRAELLAESATSPS